MGRFPRSRRILLWGLPVAALALVVGVVRSGGSSPAAKAPVSCCAFRSTTSQPTGLDAARALEAAFQQIAARALPAVVQVMGDREVRPRPNRRPTPEALPGFEHFFSGDGSPRITGTGSGFFVEPPGTIVTNAHVIRGAKHVRVKLHNGDVLNAKTLGVDHRADLAVLRVQAPPIAPLAWADSASVRPGTIVLALGSPFGLQNSVTQGIVSAVSRSSGRRSEHDFIQTDAAINAGNSGGPLLDLDGRVVGVNTAIFSTTGLSQGVGLAIPSSLARLRTAQLLAGPTGRTGWLGLVPAPGEPGVRIAGTIPGSPGARTGIRAGDRLVALNGQGVTSASQVRGLVRSRRPGQVVQLELRRGDNALRLSALLSVKPETFTASTKPAGLATLTPSLSRRQKARLQAALAKRYCPCPCGRTLINCFGCSAAKSDFTDAGWFAARDLSTPAISTLLDPPVVALAWFDYTDREGRRLMRILAELRGELGDLVRVRPRYYPAGNDRTGWHACATAVELARAKGLHAPAHHALIQDHASWQEALAQLALATRLAEQQIQEAISQNRFAAQLRKDLTAAPTQYQVRRSPTLIISGKHYTGPIDRAAIRRELKQTILSRSF
jgi:serine protease Do